MSRRVTLMLTTPGWRGSGVSFIKIATGLVAAGHAVRCIAGDHEVAVRLAAAGLTVDLVPTGDTGRREVGAVRRLFARHGADAVIGDSPRDIRIARYASWPSRRAIIWRYNLHGRRLATDVLQRWLFGGVRHVAHLSHYGARKLASDTPWLAGRPWSVIPNGFDTTLLRPDAARAAAFRETHGLSRDTTLIVTPTAALLEKAMPVAREAVERLAATHPVTWLLADRAPPITSTGLQVLGLGAVDQSGLHDAMRAADIVLLPSPAELFGNVTAEAMALGSVVVAADAAATPEVVGDAGELFRAGDARDAAALMARLLEDTPRRTALRLAARERIVEHYPLQAMQEGFDALVRSV